MRKEDMIIVSVDDHIVEPPDMFDQHIPLKYKDAAPKCVQKPTGEYTWLYEGMWTMNFAMNAVAGRPREERGFEPNSFDHIRKGCYDVDARIDDMNVNGILASVNFPTFPGFALERFHDSKDKAAALAILKAYNDWHIDEWCAAHPGRYIPLASLPLWDIQEAVTELKRVKAKGARTISMPSIPVQMGLPNIHNEYWKPLWDAVADEGIPLSLHVTSGGGTEHVGWDSPVCAFMNKTGLASMTTATEWLWSKMLREYDDFTIVIAEGGLAWAPYIMERADQVQKNHGPWTGEKWGHKKDPSEVFRDHFILSFIEDRYGVQMRDIIGTDIITFENDYPHADITWPNTPEQLFEGEFVGVPDEDINKITHLNALRVFDFDPFTILGRENCTVGALREQGKDVDMTPITGGGDSPSNELGHAVTAIDVKHLFPVPVAADRVAARQ